MKLVRDKIPQIVMTEKDSDKKFKFARVNHDYDLKQALEDKLREEIAEYTKNPCVEELADITEVLEALKNYYPKLEKTQENKREQKGAFSEGWLMFNLKKT